MTDSEIVNYLPSSDAGFAVAYDQHFKGLPHRFGEKILDLLDPIAKDKPERTILDAFCGTGHLLAQAAERGWTGEGFDSSKWMVEIANRRLGTSASVYQGDGRDYCPQINRFDAITATGEAVNHLLSSGDVLSFFKRCHSWLKSGGVLFFDFISLNEMSKMNFVSVSDNGTDQIIRRTIYSEQLGFLVARVSGHVTVEGKTTPIAYSSTEKGYSYEDLVQMLQEAGFTSNSTHSPPSFEKLTSEQASRAPGGVVMAWRS